MAVISFQLSVISKNKTKKNLVDSYYKLIYSYLNEKGLAPLRTIL